MRTEPIRILQIVSSLNAGSGVLSVVLNWHRHIDTTQIQFDYLYYIEVPVTRREEIERLGGRCYELPNPKRCPLKFLRESYRFFKQHRYRTIHSHITQLNFFFYPLAKLFGTKNIIQHAHGSRWGNRRLNKWRNYLMLHAVWPLITHKLACGQLAGKCWYGKDFTVVNNGIDLDKFCYNPDVRAQKRKELGVENNFVIGHVGRFSAEKNHAFLIEVFAEIAQKDPTAKLLLVGGGELEAQVKRLVLRSGLSARVQFLGARSDVVELYSVFDVFVFPSLNEGMPVAVIEAQASGVPCVLSDAITQEALLLPNTYMLPLSNSKKNWADKILSLKNKPHILGKDYIDKEKFDIRKIATEMKAFYQKVEK